MQFAKSYFNASLFRKNLLRFWPLWAFYTAICLFCAPLPLFLNLVNHSSYFVEENSIWLARDVVEVGMGGGLFLAAVFGIFYAMAMFSYLTNSRATQGFHALPIRREALFATQYLSGLFCMLSSLTLTALLSGFILMLGGNFHLKALLLGLSAAVLDTLFFYSFGVFCMVFTGQILAAPVFYGILNFLAIGIEMLLRSFGGVFLYGYYDSYSNFVSAPLSPFYCIIDTIRARYIYERVPDPTSVNGYDQVPVDVVLEGLSLLVIYAVVGLLFTAAALWLYRRRHSEETSTVVAITWARPIFKYGVALCAAFSFGQLIYFIIFEGFLYTRPSMAGAIMCMIFAGLIGYFAAEMLLKKRFRVWKGARGGALVLSVVLVVFGLGMAMDITGYENYVPDVDEIKYAEVNLWSNNTDVYGDFYDKETILAIQDVQRAFVADKDRWIDSEYNYVPIDYEEDEANLTLRLTYFLADGSAVHRRYSASGLRKSELADPNSLAARATEFINCDEATYTRVFGNHSSDLDLDEVTFTGGQVNAWRTDGVSKNLDFGLDAAQTLQLYTALKADLLAGHADNASLFGSDYVGSMAQKYSEERALRIDAELWFNYTPKNVYAETTVLGVPKAEVAMTYEEALLYMEPVDVPSYNSGIYIDITPNMTYAMDAVIAFSGNPDFFS